LKDIQNGLNSSPNGMCIRSLKDDVGWFCNENGWGLVYGCKKGWKMEIGEW